MHPIHPDPGFRLRRAARVVVDGGVIAYPTEAVYGLGCDPLRADAVERILALKGRDRAKGLILIAADLGQIADLLAPLPEDRLTEIRATWPGPHTWVWPAAAGTPSWLTGGRDTLAVRITAHPFAAALCRACGPLVSTSANPSGLPPARSALRVRRWFGGRLDLILSGPLGGLQRPTTIRDARTGTTLRR